MGEKAHNQLAAKLLREAAGFFVDLGERNESVQAQMQRNQKVFEGAADLIESDPHGFLERSEEKVPEGSGVGARISHTQVAARMLRDAADLFEALAEEQPDLVGQMTNSRSIYRQVAALVERDPVGTIDELLG